MIGATVPQSTGPYSQTQLLSLQIVHFVGRTDPRRPG
jgi:hypothetical protein